MEKTNDLPGPLVPSNVDLTGYPFMPFYGHRLFGSDFNAMADDTAWRAGVTLWWASWNQVPAASLPDDDVILARLAGFGRDIKSWKPIREKALHGFVKCSDGRLYHKALAPIAIEAWERRVKERQRREKWREKKHEKNTGLERSNNVVEDVPTTSQGRPNDVSETSQVTSRPVLRERDRERDRDKERNQSSSREPTARADETGEKGAALLEENPEKTALAKQILADFDAAIVAAYGPEQARPWPAATDFTLARRLVDEGCTPEIAKGVFEAICRRRAAQGQEPPKTIGYAENAVREAMKSAGKPRRNGNGRAQDAFNLSRRDQAVEDMIREKHGSPSMHGPQGWWVREFPDLNLTTAGAA